MLIWKARGRSEAGDMTAVISRIGSALARSFADDETAIAASSVRALPGATPSEEAGLPDYKSWPQTSSDDAAGFVRWST